MELKRCKYEKCNKFFAPKRKEQQYCNLTCANRHFNDNRVFSKSHKKKISKAKKGKKLSIEHCEKISNSLKKYFKENIVKLSDKTKHKISIKRKQYLKEHPEQHPNNLCRGRKSYPQNKLFETLKNNIMLNKKFILMDIGLISY
ncbi:MAG: hypothetical protein JETCAE03_32010 [Ignavibacteriaceae bacterium]|jgi:hypothetical protein|nr:MAG: hypothetical protein JETCAE03_32010 [Ignavibacteriaceae bacterium]